MDNDIAIKISHVSKIYEMYDKPIDRLKEALSFGRRNYHKDFYALNDINLEIKKGETVGIIGKNGAGKSTLLKIITGVLTPTCGEVQINGKISSLLELGAGFNPDFTGIENVYLNGFIMGYTKEEMDERLQSILDFADIGDFVYQPVKTYSSGMYVRLAFSVAINVAPDILIVDEALAVGDARFQLKCINKMSEIQKRGTTILIVTHTIETIKSFTDKAVLIDAGKVLKEGDPVEIGLEYYRMLFGDEEIIEENIESKKNDITINKNDCYSVTLDSSKHYGKKGGRITAVKILGTFNGNCCYYNDDVKVIIDYEFDFEQLSNIVFTRNVLNIILFGLRIENSSGVVLTDLASSINERFNKITAQKNLKKLRLIFNFKIPNLLPGEYWFSPELAIGEQNNLVQLSEYVYMFSLKILEKEKVLGLLKIPYKIEKGDE